MRIKKKDLLEAFKPEKVANDLENAKKFIEGPTKDFIDSTTKTLGNDDNAKKIANNVAGLIVGPDEVKEEKEEIKSKKKRVKEVVKVKNLKK